MHLRSSRWLELHPEFLMQVRHDVTNSACYPRIFRPSEATTQVFLRAPEAFIFMPPREMQNGTRDGRIHGVYGDFVTENRLVWSRAAHLHHFADRRARSRTHSENAARAGQDLHTNFFARVRVPRRALVSPLRTCGQAELRSRAMNAVSRHLEPRKCMGNAARAVSNRVPHTETRLQATSTRSRAQNWAFAIGA